MTSNVGLLRVLARVFRVFNIASEDEANAIIDAALNKTGDDALKRSTVGSGQDEDGNDRAREDSGRTSDNAWDHSSPAAKLLIARSFRLTNIEEDDGKRDGLQIVRYAPGQGYNTHPDYFTSRDEGSDFDFNPYSGGSNRFATVFLYLNNPEEGGCTVFPRAPAVGPTAEMPPEAQDMFKKGTWEHTVNKQCYTQLAVPPKVRLVFSCRRRPCFGCSCPRLLPSPLQMGTAALFYSTLPDGQIDPMSHHAACPLIKGTKWGANIWIWNRQRFGDIRTGDPRGVVMKNLADETVYISWEGKDNGSILPGKQIVINSFEYHRFKASFRSHKDAAFEHFTVQSQPEDKQVWEIKPPRRASTTVETKQTTVETKQIALLVQNRLNHVVDIRYDGKSFLAIKPGESTHVNSFEGHAFEAAVDDGVHSTYACSASAEQTWVISGAARRRRHKHVHVKRHLDGELDEVHHAPEEEEEEPGEEL